MNNWNELPEDARVWIYQSDRVFTTEDIQTIEKSGIEFIDSWTAHGSKMKAAFKVEHNAFIIIGADEKATMASGCSIDASVHFIQTLGKNLNIDFFNRMNLAIVRNEEISFVQSSNISKEIEQGSYSEEDFTFNNLVSSISDFKSNWKIPIKNSWVAQVL